MDKEEKQAAMEMIRLCQRAKELGVLLLLVNESKYTKIYCCSAADPDVAAALAGGEGLFPKPATKTPSSE